LNFKSEVLINLKLSILWERISMAIFAKYRYKISIMSNIFTERKLKVLRERLMQLKIKKIGLLVDIQPNTNPIDGLN